MAFTRDLSTSFPIESYQSHRGENKRYTASYEIVFTSANELAQNEIMKITEIPAGVAVTSAMAQIVTVNADVADIDIGVGTVTTTLANIFDGISLVTAGYLAANNLTVTNGGTYAVATNNISLTNKDASTLSSGKIKVILELIDFRNATV